MHFYQHNVGEFSALTRCMSLEEIGLAVMLIDEYVRTEKPISYETFAMYVDSLASRQPVASDSLASRYEKRVLRRVFVETPDGFTCPMIDGQLQKYAARAAINRANASRPRRSRKTVADISENSDISDSLATCKQTVSETQASRYEVASESLTNKKQETRNKKQESSSKDDVKKPRAVSVPRPEDVPEDVWRDFLAARKGKAFTPTALKGFEREAAKAGITVAEAIRIAAERGWQGFKADWNWQDSASKPKVEENRLDPNFDWGWGA